MYILIPEENENSGSLHAVFSILTYTFQTFDKPLF